MKWEGSAPAKTTSIRSCIFYLTPLLAITNITTSCPMSVRDALHIQLAMIKQYTNGTARHSSIR